MTSDTTIMMAQFAAVRAALQDEFPLGEILQAEELSDSSWQSSRAEWLSQIASDPAIHERYEASLAAAQDHLKVSVEPLFENIEAWMSFLAVGAAAGSDPLTLGDRARLQRHWSQQFEQDKTLADEAKILRAKEARQLIPPKVVVGERVLVASVKDDDTAQPEGTSVKDEAPKKHHAELVELAALMHACIDAGLSEQRMVERFRVRSMSDAKRRVGAFFTKLGEDDGVEYRRRVDHHRRVLDATAARPGEGATGSPTFSEPDHRPVAPVRQVASEAVPQKPATLSQQQPPPANSLDETAIMVGPIDFGDDLPFEGARDAPPESANGDDDSDMIGETGVLNLEHLEKLATPFESDRDELPPIDSTAIIDHIALDLPKLPFKKGPARPPPPSVDLESEPGSTDLDGTAIASPTRPRTLPFAKSGGDSDELAPNEHQPRNVLTDPVWYARYCAELEQYGFEAIGPRHRVPSQRDHVLLQAAWTEKMAMHSDLRSRFAAEYRSYSALLIEREKEGERTS